MYIPEKRKNRQITLFDFNQSCGMELDPNNEWIKLAHAIPWNRMETKYVAMFPSKTGRPATPFRMALGVLIIQKRKKLSDRAVIKEIQENPYLQYFLGKKTGGQTHERNYNSRIIHTNVPGQAVDRSRNCSTGENSRPDGSRKCRNG